MFFDAECGFCMRFARWLTPILKRRGMETAPLQDPRVGALLGMNRQELLREIRLLLSDGRQYGGASALLAMAREVWWARPLVWIAGLPGMTGAFDSAYHWMAAQRSCVAESCATMKGSRR